MSADYFFRMGSTHSICQDYAIAGEKVFTDLDGKNIPMEYAILSDGCSGIPKENDPGSPYTDIGARFLTLAARRHLRDTGFLGRPPKDRILSDAEAGIRAMGLPASALDATLLVAIAAEKYARVFQFGDGVIVTRERDGKIHYDTRKFGNNMPFYLRYTSDFNQECQYKDEAKTVTTTSGWTDEQGVWQRRESTINIEDMKRDSFDRIYGRDDTSLILLLSDGAESFVSNEAVVPLEEVLTELLNFKGYAGQFIQRRGTAFLKRFCAETGWSHSDDFSMAGIFLEETR